MQSGISASQELLARFNELVGSDAHFGLVATISGESLVPGSFLTPPSSSSSFGSKVDALVRPLLKDKEALYMVLRRYDSAPRLVAVTYVPDAAPVRQKMLFASTRLTLVRELGSEYFRESMFATTPNELTAAGFERHDAHAAVEAPLTEEERSLGEVRRAEQHEAARGTGVREIHLSKTMNMPVGEDALAALKEMADPEGGRGLVMLKINADSESIELVDSTSTPASVGELVADTISATEPRFTFYRYTHEYGGGSSSPLLFFYTCPMTPGNKAIKFRMMYPLMKRAVLQVATDECGLSIDKKFEVEEPTELTDDVVLAELHPHVSERKGFSRPKRPGR